MISRSTLRRWISRGALPLAMWAALPMVQWCPDGWQELCVMGMAPPCAEADSCPLAMAGESCSPEDAPACAPCGRALCMSGPNGGAALVVNGIHIERAPGLVHALFAPVPSLDAGTASRRVTVDDERPPPETPARLHPARAPPGLRG